MKGESVRDEIAKLLWEKATGISWSDCNHKNSHLERADQILALPVGNGTLKEAIDDYAALLAEKERLERAVERAIDIITCTSCPRQFCEGTAPDDCADCWRDYIMRDE